MKTVFDWLKWGESQLADRSSEPDIDAHACWLAAFDWSKETLLSQLSDAVEDDARLDHYQRSIEERNTGKPLAYVLGWSWFYGSKYVIQPGVLVPRQETELLVEHSLRVINEQRISTVLELGCGSGIITLELAKRCPHLQCHAWDVSETAIDCSTKNANRFGIDHVQWHFGDFFDGQAIWRPLLEAKKPVLLVSNPPYIPTEDVAQLEPQVRDFEPTIALDGGEDGLAYYRRLVALCRLYPHVCLAIEVGIHQRMLIEGLCDGFTMQWTQDLQGIDRVGVLTL